ncbi:unnamed protein product, partial [Nesidiocoris tenuis]
MDEEQTSSTTTYPLSSFSFSHNDEKVDRALSRRLMEGKRHTRCPLRVLIIFTSCIQTVYRRLFRRIRRQTPHPTCQSTPMEYEAPFTRARRRTQKSKNKRKWLIDVFLTPKKIG